MTGVYSIVEWNERYENSQSRKVADLSWVPVPNSHDTEGFAFVMAHPKGAEIFTAFILMLQVASKCSRRGVLANKKGIPYTAESLAVKTRGKAQWFTAALEFLSSDEVGWLSFEPNTVELVASYEPTGSELVAGYKPGGEERKKEQKEQKESTDFDFLETIKKEYPSRKGDQGWKKVETAIKSIPLKDRDLVIQGIIGYRKFCESEQSIGTTFVKQAITFFNGETWREYQPTAAISREPEYEYIEGEDGELRKVLKVAP